MSHSTSFKQSYPAGASKIKVKEQIDWVNMRVRTGDHKAFGYLELKLDSDLQTEGALDYCEGGISYVPNLAGTLRDAEHE